MKPAWLTERHLQPPGFAWIVDSMIRTEQLCSQQMIVIGRRGGSQRLKVTPPLRFTFSSDATFESRWFQSLERNKTMNSKKFVLLSCVVGSVFAVSTATAQMRG